MKIVEGPKLINIVVVVVVVVAYSLRLAFLFTLCFIF